MLTERERISSGTCHVLNVLVWTKIFIQNSIKFKKTYDKVLDWPGNPPGLVVNTEDLRSESCSSDVGLNPGMTYKLGEKDGPLHLMAEKITKKWRQPNVASHTKKIFWKVSIGRARKTPVVNFINILRMNFSYECCFL
jgi:hypothetical protein